MSWEEAIEETRAVSEANALRQEAEDRFNSMNPFFEGQMYPVLIQVTDRKRLWDFVAANLYAENEDIPGGKIVGVQLEDSKAKLDELLNWMEDFLRKSGRR